MNRSTRYPRVLEAICVLGFLLASAASLCSAGEPASGKDLVDFENDLIPVFTKMGCNAGKCHGSAIGRGGFKLSLYGGNPSADYEEIVQRTAGRRVNLAKPEESLIVLKPTENLEHGGGFLMHFGDEGTERLLEWIRQGAKHVTHRKLKRIDISPQEYIATKVGDSVEMKATAQYSDGTTQDVTLWTAFTAEDSSAVEVDSESATSKMLRRGRHIVVARYLSEVVPIEFLVPLTDTKVDLAAEPRNNFIDDCVLASLTDLRLPVSPMADDVTFIRRVTLDLTGRLPAVDRVVAFLTDRDAISSPLSPENSDVEALPSEKTQSEFLGERARVRGNHSSPRRPPHPNPLPQTAGGGVEENGESNAPAIRERGGKNKREALVDELLASDEFVEFWTLKLAKLFRIHSKKNKALVTVTPEAAYAFHEWLSDQLRDRVGYDQLVRKVILASGDTNQVGPANFYITVEDPKLQTEFMTELFMGSRMKCANCHNHPLDKWTQDDYHGLTAIFAKITRQRIVKLNPVGKAIHPVSGQPALMRIPGAGFLPEQTSDGREALVNWLTAPENPYFAKAIVNRLWKSIMGRGLVEPVDDFRATNPATHPVLMTRLADDFVDHGYDLRHTLKRIATSAAYARSAATIPENAADDRYYSHALRKPLEPEVLADAISDVLGVPDAYGSQPVGTRAVALFDASIKSDALDILGRCDRTASCESAPAPWGALSQKLHLFNGELLNARLGVAGSRLDTLISAGKAPMEIVDEFYLAALSQRPGQAESRFLSKLFDANKPASEQRDRLEDLVWGLVTSRRFASN